MIKPPSPLVVSELFFGLVFFLLYGAYGIPLVQRKIEKNVNMFVCAHLYFSWIFAMAFFAYVVLYHNEYPELAYSAMVWWVSDSIGNDPVDTALYLEMITKRY